MSSKSKEMILLAVIGALIFLVALFLFLDLIPSTLTYPEKTERLVGRKVLSSFPIVEPEKEDEPLYQMSLKYLCKVISVRVEAGKTLVINMLSVEPEQGKSYFAEKLESAFDKRGYAVKYICYNRDFDEDSRQYDLATSVKDLLTNNARSYDIVIVEHPALVDKNVPTRLLKEHCINLLVCKATEAWTQSNAEALNRIDPNKSLNIEVLLNGVKPQIMEGYVGLIPPITVFKQFEYNLLNLNLRALFVDIFKSKKKKVSKDDTEIDTEI